MSIILFTRNRMRVNALKKLYGEVHSCTTASAALRNLKQNEGPHCLIIDTCVFRNPKALMEKCTALTRPPLILLAGKDPVVSSRKKLEIFNCSWKLLFSLRSRMFLAPFSRNKKETPPLIGSSALMEKLREEIKRAAGAGCPVQISGETGTGKEIASCAIHALSDVGEKKMVTVNCSLLSETLAANILFGVKKGAFTDSENLTGLAESAHHSSLFFDEIETLKPSVQPTLLRFLEDGSYSATGSNAVKVSNFRLITASNVPYEFLVERNLLRRDLFYRISGYRIRMPALREHPEDIPELIDYFLKSENEERTLKNEDIKRLSDARWPGNVRQLFNLLKCAVAYSGKDSFITIPDHLFPEREQRLFHFSTHLSS